MAVLVESIRMDSYMVAVVTVQLVLNSSCGHCGSDSPLNLSLHICSVVTSTNHNSEIVQLYVSMFCINVGEKKKTTLETANLRQENQVNTVAKKR